jgi:hydrogenase maturation protease
MKPRILVAGVGNIFLGDDAFGVEVVRRLTERTWPDEVRIVDFGVRGLDLTYALLDGYEAVILVDAAPRGGPPGTLYVLEPTPDEAAAADGTEALIDLHGMDPAKVLRLVTALGGRVERLYLVGCEPAPVADLEEMQMEMSAAVRAAVEQAIPLVEELVGKLVRGALIEAS